MIEPSRLRGTATSRRGRSGSGATPRRSAARCRRCWRRPSIWPRRVAMGFHGRRRAGHGENFWQYRQAVPGDPRSAVDWRRSGKSDQQFIREMEWEAAQTVSLWVDDAQSMDYRDPTENSRARSKGERAALLALAVSVLLIKAGERVALMGTDAAQPRAGRAQLNRMALALGGEPARRPARLRRAAGRPHDPRRARGVLLGLPRRSRRADAGAGACRRPGGARLLRAGARRERGGVSVRRADDLREHGRHHRVRDPAGAGAARGLRRAARGAHGGGWSSSRATSAGAAVPPHQPEPARGAALALHGAGRAGVRAMIGAVAFLRRGCCSGSSRCRCSGGCCGRCRRRRGGGCFPGVRLLLGLTDPEKMPERTPWWLLLLRMAALAAAILAFAGPVLNPRPEGSDAAAAGAARRRLGRRAGLAAADGAGRRGARRRRRASGRPAAVVTMADAAGRPDEDAALAGGGGVDRAAGRPRRRGPGRRTAPPGPAGSPARDEPFETLWLSDGIGTGGETALARGAARRAGR